MNRHFMINNPRRLKCSVWFRWPRTHQPSSAVRDIFSPASFGEVEPGRFAVPSVRSLLVSPLHLTYINWQIKVEWNVLTPDFGVVTEIRAELLSVLSFFLRHEVGEMSTVALATVCKLTTLVSFSQRQLTAKWQPEIDINIYLLNCWVYCQVCLTWQSRFQLFSNKYKRLSTSASSSASAINRSEICSYAALCHT